MCAVLDELGLTALVTSIDGLSAVGAAVILAETGDLSRFASAAAVVKHAGLNPAENTSATLPGQTRISRRGRPGAAAAAWRAAWGGAAPQPGAGRQVRAPDQPGRQPAGRRAGPRRVRRDAAALAVGRRHPAAALGRPDRGRGPSPPAPAP